jgi:hypothetical protein
MLLLASISIWKSSTITNHQAEDSFAPVEDTTTVVETALTPGFIISLDSHRLGQIL